MNRAELLDAVGQPDMSALWDEEARWEDQVAAYQSLINTGDAWRMDGHTGRTAMSLIEDGYCTLGEVGHRDYYGNYVPARNEVKEGTKGSLTYARRLQPDFHPIGEHDGP